MTNRLLLVKHTALCDGNFLPVVFFQAFAFHHPSQKEISIQAGVGVLRYEFLREASRAPFGMQTPDGRQERFCVRLALCAVQISDEAALFDFHLFFMIFFDSVHVITAKIII